MVAIELAASWKPLTKSKASASPMIAQATQRSGIFQDDPFEDVGHVLAAVGGRLEILVDVLPLDDLGRLVLVVEERGQGVLLDPVRLVLLPVDGDAPLQDLRSVLHVLEERNGLEDERRGVAKAPREEKGVLR